MLVDRAGVEVEHLRDHPDLAARAGDRLADVLRLDPGELLGFLLHERRKTAEEAGAVGRYDGAPRGKRRLRAGGGRVGLLNACLLELGDGLLRRRVEDRERHGPDSNTRSRVRGSVTRRRRSDETRSNAGFVVLRSAEISSDGRTFYPERSRSVTADPSTRSTSQDLRDGFNDQPDGQDKDEEDRGHPFQGILADDPDFRLALHEGVTVEVDAEALGEDGAHEAAVEAWLVDRVVSAWASRREAAVEMSLRFQAPARRLRPLPLFGNS